MFYKSPCFYNNVSSLLELNFSIFYKSTWFGMKLPVHFSYTMFNEPVFNRVSSLLKLTYKVLQALLSLNEFITVLQYFINFQVL